MIMSLVALGAKGGLLDEMDGVTIRTARSSSGIVILAIGKH